MYRFKRNLKTLYRLFVVFSSIDELRTPLDRRMSDSLTSSRLQQHPAEWQADPQQQQSMMASASSSTVPRLLTPQLARPLLAATSQGELRNRVLPPTQVPPQLPLRKGGSLDRVTDPHASHAFAGNGSLNSNCSSSNQSASQCYLIHFVAIFTTFVITIITTTYSSYKIDMNYI